MAIRWAAGGKRWAALLSGSALAACTFTYTASTCERCESESTACKDLLAWLQRHGADTNGIDFRQSQNSGMGVFATESLHKQRGSGFFWRSLSRLGLPVGSITVATFPVQLIINQHTIVQDPKIGNILEAHLSSGDLDPVAALQVWLLAQRKLGSSSEHAPYIASLPTPDVPIMYTEELLHELAGTEVHAAVHSLRLKLQTTWGSVQPILREVGIACQADFCDLSIDEWTWAFSILTSRSFNIPQSSKSNGATVMSLIPGLDFINHRKSSGVRWTLDGNIDGVNGCIKLKSPAHSLPRTGEEICIAYSQDASNFVLLLQYGFVDEVNEHDCVRIRYPYDAPELQNDLMKTKLAVLKDRKLPLDFLLQAWGDPNEPLPKVGKDILQVFTMSPKAIENCTAAPAVEQKLELGDELAIYTTFCWLLEQHLQSLEGPKGTCSLSEDIELIQRGPAELPHAYWNTVLYRANQKHIVRTYAKAARSKVQDIIAEMHSGRE